MQPKGKIASTIFREVAPDLMNPGRGYRWIPAFILQNTGANAVEGLNIKDMAALAGERPLDFVQERIIRPLLRSYLGMGLVEGLPGELHTQSFYYRLKKTGGGWLPTGEVMFKDNDGFRFNTELASRYYKLIRNVNGFETLAAYLLRAINEIDPRARMDKDGIQKLFDHIAAQEAEKITGLRLAEADFGFGQDKGLSRILGEWRAKLALLSPEALERLQAQQNDERLQKLLAKEWTRLKTESRVSPLRRSLSTVAFYYLYKMIDGTLVIEARTPKTTAASPDPVIGFALLEGPQTAEGITAQQRLGRFAVQAKKVGSMLDSRSIVARSESRAPALTVVERTQPTVVEPVRTAAELRRLPVAERCEAMFVSVQAASGRRCAR